MSKLNQSEEISLATILKRSIKFSLLFFLFAITMLLVLSLICVRLEDPSAWITIIGKLSLFLSAMICGFLLSRKNKQSYFLSGILLGGLITGLIFIASLIYPDSTQNSILWLLLIPISTILGSLLGIKRNFKKHKHIKFNKWKISTNCGDFLIKLNSFS